MKFSSCRYNQCVIDFRQATRSPRRFTALIARTKGAAEACLLDLILTYPSLRVFNVRPGCIDDTGSQLKEGKKSFAYTVIGKMAPVLSLAWPNGVSPTGQMAGVLVRCLEERGTKTEVREAFEGKGVKGTGFSIENTGIRRLRGNKYTCIQSFSAALDRFWYALCSMAGALGCDRSRDAYYCSFGHGRPVKTKNLNNSGPISPIRVTKHPLLSLLSSFQHPSNVDMRLCGKEQLTPQIVVWPLRIP